MNTKKTKKLQWSKEAPKRMTWNEAQEYAKNLREGGYDDWRLPTLAELTIALANQFIQDGAKEPLGFRGGYNYWSSLEVGADGAWYAYGGSNGGVYTNYVFKDYQYAVRCAR